MNWRRGLKRITWLVFALWTVSFFIFVPKIADWGRGRIESISPAYISELIVAIIAVVMSLIIWLLPVWIIYWLLCWVVKGFADDKPKN